MTAELGTTPRFAIVGAGLGGLLCARILQKHHHPVTVFERKRPAAVPSPGGALGLQPDTVDALRDADLLDKVTALARSHGREVRTLDSDATLLHRRPPTDDATGTPEIGCVHLQRLLLDSLAKGTICWGTSVEQVVPLADGTSRLRLAGGTSQDFDLVIGADGAWSTTRQALSDAVPTYLGTALVETHINQADTRHRRVLRLAGTGSMVARAGTKALMAEHDGHGRLRLRAAFRAPENWHTGLNFEDAKAVRTHLLTMYDGWDESLLDLLRVSDGDFVNRPLYALPTHTWDHVPGITLLGDAAHLMPPFGSAADLALLDGADLAQALVTEDTVNEAVRAYEDMMRTHWAAAAKSAAEVMARLGQAGPLLRY